MYCIDQVLKLPLGNAPFSTSSKPVGANPALDECLFE